MRNCDNPLISVIVPVYNTEQYLPKCIKSILNQTYRNIELILVDDGSTDGSGKICDEYARMNSHVTAIHKENGGQASARNVGLDLAKGSIISFVDSDDFIETDMLECLYSQLQSSNNQISMCGRFNVNEETNSKSEFFTLAHLNSWEKTEAIKRFLLSDKIDGSPCDKLIPKELIGSVRFPVGYICEDIPFIYEVLKKCDCVRHIGLPKYNYVQRNGSTSKPLEISEKERGMILYPEAIRADVITNFPDLKNEADYFYLSRCLIFQEWKRRSLKSDPSQKKNLENLKREYSIIADNPYFSARTKMKALIYKCGFSSLYLAWRMIRDYAKTIIPSS